MKIYVGTSGFAYKEWKGPFYPEKISPKEMLRSYAVRLNTVEINNTFYHMPTKDVLSAWAEQVPEGFLFALKAPQAITHFKRLRNVFEETEYLLGTLALLSGKLGPVLFQFPRTFKMDRPALEDFLELIPEGTACAFEFRSPSWIEGGVVDLLREKGCSLCIADADDAPAGEIVSTTDWGYLRLRRSDYADADLAGWAERILSQQWERAFVFFKHEGEEARGPKLAMRFQELVDERLAPGGLKKAG
ncbi:MAG: DUF72 domain-containing protein [Nitrospiraceae bacterium]|nr:DUF72 domain-containing protein [Nitrospiraceae bacterium]